ncbi:hypothetical protein N9B69_01680 [Amylibacter sp.]|nr:hypothetical protein [Amylibacter sp.]
MNTLSKIGLLVAFLITVGYVIMLSGVTPTIQPRRTPAPENFNAASFTPFKDIKSNDQVDVLHLNTFGNPSFYYFLPDERVAYFNIGTSDYSSFYLFVNRTGDEIGRIKNTRVTSPIGNIFVDAEGYYTVTSQSVSGLTPYVEINNREPVSFKDIETLYNQSTLHRSVSHTDMEKDSVERTQKLTTHIMLIDGVWTVATTASKEYLQWKVKPFPDFTTQYEFSPKDAPQSARHTYGGSNFFGGKYAVYQTWFDQQEYYRRRAASIGSTTGQGRAEHWRGIGYYTVTAGNGSIGFSVQNDTQNLSGSGRQWMNVKGHETLDFIILQRYVGNRQDVYIFKSKTD